MQDNLSQEVRESLEYLKTGGLGEVIGITDIARHLGQPKVQSDTSLMIALCILASEGLEALATQPNKEA